jgi:hypothetical protein
VKRPDGTPVAGPSAHQVRDQTHRALVAVAVELGRDPPAPESLPRGVEHPLDVPGQLRRRAAAGDSVRFRQA